MTTDDSLRARTIRLFEYLQAVRALREQPVRDIVDYQDRRWWAGDIPAHRTCVVTASGEEPWLTVSKATLPPIPDPPVEVQPYLAFPPNDPGRDPALVTDLDEMLADEPERVADLREALRRYTRTDMLDIPTLRYLASETGKPALVVWIDVREQDYGRGLLDGFRAED